MSADSHQIDVIWEVQREKRLGIGLEDFIHELFLCLEQDPSELAILVTDDDKMKDLNQRYRKREGTTDVLSFPSADGQTPEGRKHLGDIVISYERAETQGKQIGHGAEKEIRFLCLHGILHLLGYDHETDGGEMLALQSRLKLQLANYF